jgi:aspartate carbamoyltransferase regulatory subunit
MLWREAENAHICPRLECGRRIESAFKIAKRGPPASGVKCPYCNADTTLLREVDHEHFAFAGWRNHTLKCVNCEKQIERPWKPDGGYKI